MQALQSIGPQIPHHKVAVQLRGVNCIFRVCAAKYRFVGAGITGQGGDAFI